MKSAATRFVLVTLLITVACALLQVVWNRQAPETLHLKNGFVLLAVFTLTVTAIHLFLLSAAKGEPQAFIRKYLATTVFKFLFYIFLLLLFLLFSKENKIALILHFLFYYSVFTVSEVALLFIEMQKLKKNP